mgnify:CR=1 FL=1
MRLSIIEFLSNLSHQQLLFCQTECDKRIRAIQAEEKKVAWAVTDGGINVGWFRTEDYEKAVECLAKEAAERWKESSKEMPETTYDLNLAIEGTRLPLSEYNELFSDGQWG